MIELFRGNFLSTDRHNIICLDIDLCNQGQENTSLGYMRIIKADLSSYKPPPYFFNIKSISVHPLLWKNVMLDFICMVFAGMWTTFR